ncbi:MAG: DUF5011 domain-containing protein [Bacilli bacterium]|nr:DUF5011 domain-containing protein [Bacilli bacterium]MDD4282901.1 DUF5011 domain-containing protein [Bacilli bacterium]MDD4718690.1 DUF5011 domain-containing protein [Bacilli bacterium]
MKKINKKRIKRIRNLIVSSVFMAMFFSITTYAWFIGMRTVNISTFDVQIASTESLLLSLNGTGWDTTVTIAEDILDQVSYSGHTNSWGGAGLIPLSTAGAINSEASRLTMFEKGSLTPTSGGYRLLASPIDNTGPNEADGYVVFDLFVKNMTGGQYIYELNKLDEEAVFLDIDSFVDVASGGVAGTGIENSVRVAFAEIGRVHAQTASVDDITGITCASNSVVTGICRDAKIWEPNDSKHEDSVITWFGKTCKKRNGADVYNSDSFGEPCTPLVADKYYPTYVVKEPIKSSDHVDVYDAPEYNTYTGTTKLINVKTFTDEHKDLAGNERKEFITLAANSVTKLRVYIYIEGQDVDNYDFASIGRKISVKFGFTKERYTEEDVDYEGPDLDKDAPQIGLIGDDPMTIALGTPYFEPGARAKDNMDADITEKIIITGDVNTEETGTYTVTYEVTDRAGNTTTVTRTVIVE